MKRRILTTPIEPSSLLSVKLYDAKSHKRISLGDLMLAYFSLLTRLEKEKIITYIFVTTLVCLVRLSRQLSSRKVWPYCWFPYCFSFLYDRISHMAQTGTILWWRSPIFAYHAKFMCPTEGQYIYIYNKRGKIREYLFYACIVIFGKYKEVQAKMNFLVNVKT